MSRFRKLEKTAISESLQSWGSDILQSTFTLDHDDSIAAVLAPNNKTTAEQRIQWRQSIAYLDSQRA